MMSETLQHLSKAFADEVVDTHCQHGDDTAIVKPGRLTDIVRFLRDDPKLSLEMLVDLTGVDYLGKKEPRFEVVYHFYSLSLNHRLRLKVGAEDEDPRVPSVVEIYKSALWMEREAYDLYGIIFEGHPIFAASSCIPSSRDIRSGKTTRWSIASRGIPPRSGRRHL